MKIFSSSVLILLSALMPALSLGATITDAKTDVSAIRRLLPQGRYASATATIKGNYALVNGYQGEANGGTTCFQKTAATWRVTGYFGSKGETPIPLAARYCHWSESKYSEVYSLRADAKHNVRVLP